MILVPTKSIIVPLAAVPTGLQFVCTSAFEARVSYNPAPFVEMDPEPIKLILCNHEDYEQVQEAVADEER